ncbi:hypothetical protein OC835_006640 [Tilletia horrida]|nr:hypothetical protein OC835_006640 [Tilletia horrida]
MKLAFTSTIIIALLLTLSGCSISVALVTRRWSDNRLPERRVMPFASFQLAINKLETRDGHDPNLHPWASRPGTFILPRADSHRLADVQQAYGMGFRAETETGTGTQTQTQARRRRRTSWSLARRSPSDSLVEPTRLLLLSGLDRM